MARTAKKYTKTDLVNEYEAIKVRIDNDTDYQETAKICLALAYKCNRYAESLIPPTPTIKNMITMGEIVKSAPTVQTTPEAIPVATSAIATV